MVKQFPFSIDMKGFIFYQRKAILNFRLRVQSGVQLNGNKKFPVGQYYKILRSMAPSFLYNSWLNINFELLG